MNTRLTIKNFRIFDEDGVTVDIKPITVLTGCNSSGKSSVVKAALMLNDVLRQLKAVSSSYADISDIKIDFTTYPNNLLGRFDNVLNNSKSGKITLEYTIYSKMISKDITVSLEFVADKNSKMNNAHLDNFKISIDDGVVFWVEKDLEAQKRREEVEKKRIERKKNEYDKSPITRTLTDLFLSSGSVFHYMVNANLVRKEFVDYAVFKFLTIIAYNSREERESYEISDEKFKSINETIDQLFPKLYEIHKMSDTRLKDIAQSDAKGICKSTQDLYNISRFVDRDSLFDIPVLEDLDKISKDEFVKYISDNDFVEFMSSSIFTNGKYVEKYSAVVKEICIKYTKEVVDCFLVSDSVKLSEYFYKLANDYLSSADLPAFESFGNIADRAHSVEIWEDKNIFSKTYIVLMYWNLKMHSEKSTYYDLIVFDYPNWGTDQSFEHKSIELFKKFLHELFIECMSPSFYGTMTYVSSSRATIKRLYQLDKKDDFTILLKRYMESPEKGAFINKWLKKFGIGDSISFDIDEDGVGAKIRIHKTPDDTKGRLLADEGYGITQLISIMLQIEMSSVHDNWSNVTLAIEEPEIHLHPKYQSLLADMFVDAYRSVIWHRSDHKRKKYSEYADKLIEMSNANIPFANGNHFIIETHSEYLIRRLQLLVAGVETEEKLDKDDVSISYIYTKEEAEKAGQPLVKNIAICDDGYLDDTFGSGFFDEATNLSRKLM